MGSMQEPIQNLKSLCSLTVPSGKANIQWLVSLITSWALKKSILRYCYQEVAYDKSNVANFKCWIAPWQLSDELRMPLFSMEYSSLLLSSSPMAGHVFLKQLICPQDACLIPIGHCSRMLMAPCSPSCGTETRKPFVIA